MRIPAYRVKDAARYANVDVRTVNSWQKASGVFLPALGARGTGDALSYLQLIELRFVAFMREAGVSLKTIRLAREYLASKWHTEYPFALEKLKTDGQHVIQDVDENEGTKMAGKVLICDKGGQLSWKPIIGGRLQEFEYEDSLVMRWRLAGPDSPVVIDPRVAFGAPMVKGVPTWVLLGRHDAGESSEEIAEDFRLNPAEVRAALEFELQARKKKQH